MSTADAAWEERVAQLKALDRYEPEEFVAQLNTLVAELPPGSAIGLFSVQPISGYASQPTSNSRPKD